MGFLSSHDDRMIPLLLGVSRAVDGKERDLWKRAGIYPRLAGINLRWARDYDTPVDILGIQALAGRMMEHVRR